MRRSLNRYTLNELIQKPIGEVRMLSHPTSTSRSMSLPLSKEIEECEFQKKFSTNIQLLL